MDAGRITQERFDAMLVSIKLTMEERIDGQRRARDDRSAVCGPSSESAAPAQTGTIISLAAHGELDQLACSLVSLALDLHGSGTITLPVATPHGLVERIAAGTVQAVCISALGSQSTMRAIAWARVLRHRFPELAIVIGRWNQNAVGAKRLERDRMRYGYDVVTTLKEAVMRLSLADAPTPLPPPT